MKSCCRPTINVSFRRPSLEPCELASPNGLSFHDMEQLLLDIQMESSYEDGMSLDEEIVEVFMSACPSPSRPTSEDPIAKTITMIDSDFSDMPQRSSPNIFRPISVC
eukprot:CAMPEP_0184674748 /NCGR_PEP_ID=MMETSP0308-20130426/87410_1 /TAXON_ID=38269 /ORGANISM="Gloeochaete witrockiana, Strain SAG 46.84" /LENGTH=106 /DNA_ID=CAMNT_0027122389 /DNA_START=189 /DNA_END=509 /DNA_ORIENTATION=+